MASDLHAGSMSGEKDTEWMVQHLNALNPDAVALVGDIGDQTVNDVLRQKLAPLTKLEAPDGVFYSFGNHENKNHIEG
jgi:predicted MPP superfamily phosphohydrolase